MLSVKWKRQVWKYMVDLVSYAGGRSKVVQRKVPSTLLDSRIVFGKEDPPRGRHLDWVTKNR